MAEPNEPNEPDTLCGWDEKNRVDTFVEKSDLIVPKRYEQLHTLVDLFPWATNDAIRVLDLGAGYGAATETILSHYPNATVVWVDGSQAMLEHAQPRLAHYGRQVQLLLRDLANPLWAVDLQGPFHAAVSAIALHHLTDIRKRQLCRDVFDLLQPGGLFLNDDVIEGAPELRQYFMPVADRAIQHQIRHKTGPTRSREQIQAEIVRVRTGMQRPEGKRSYIAPLETQLDWWRQAGFGIVDCYWRFLNFAIWGGVKPE